MASFLSTLGQNIKAIPQMAKDIGRNILGSPIGRATSSVRSTAPTAPTASTVFGGGASRGAGASASYGTPYSSKMDLYTQSENSLKDQIANAIIQLEAKLDSIPGLTLTEEEKQSFLQKAIAQIAPYYDKKKAEVENGINTGKIRSAEDVLLNIRDVRAETSNLLARYDIEQAQTEEEFVNTMADITATEGETLETSRYNWRNRVKDVKQSQVERNVLTSGIGKKEVGELLTREGQEEASIQRGAGQVRTEAETGQKYDLDKISLARQAVESERQRLVGGPEQEAETTGLALGTAGISTLADLPSRYEIDRRRGETPTTIYSPESLTNLAEQRKQAVESRKLTLQQEELDIRSARRAAELQKAEFETLRSLYG